MQRTTAKPRRLFTGILRRKTGGVVESVEYDTLMRTRFSLGLSYKIQNGYCTGQIYTRTIIHCLPEIQI